METRKTMWMEGTPMKCTGTVDGVRKRRPAPTTVGGAHIRGPSSPGAVSARSTESPFSPELYRQWYADRFDDEVDWLRQRAGQRVGYLAELLARRGVVPGSILDIGCGTGAILRELQRRGIGRELRGIDYSAEAVAYVRTKVHGVDCLHADISSPDFPQRPAVDLVLLIHVLQYLADPSACLSTLLRRVPCSFIAIQVPLEDTLVNRTFRGRHTGSVHRFNLRGFIALLETSGLNVLETLHLVPVLDLDTIDVLRKRYRMTDMQYWRKVFSANLLPHYAAPLMKRMHYSECAILCAPIG